MEIITGSATDINISSKIDYNLNTTKVEKESQN
jgi:hypothetical protein